MTVPNFLTFARILLTPFLIWCLVQRKMDQALIIFVVAGLTDGLDGLVARLLHQKSRLGACLDPLADKFLLVSSFILLGWLGAIPLWLVIVAIGRDVMIVSGVLALMILNVPLVIQPTLLGKLTTLTQLLVVLLVLGSSVVPLDPSAYRGWFLIAGLFSLASGFQYWRIGWGLRRSVPPGRTGSVKSS